MGERYIVIVSDYSDGDNDGPFRDSRSNDITISAGELRILDAGVYDAYMQLVHDGYKASIFSSGGMPVYINNVNIESHIDRHLGNGDDSLYEIATRDPTIADDGYDLGNRWINTSDGYEFVIVDNTSGAAVWMNTTGGGSGSGISELEHETLDTLVHNINETSYDEVTRSGSKITSIITWDSASKTKKVREILMTYSGSKVTQVISHQYNPSGSVIQTLTENYTYVGLSRRVSSITRIKS